MKKNVAPAAGKRGPAIKKKTLLWVATAVLGVGIAAGGYLYWRGEQRRETASACLPRTFNLQGRKPELVSRIQDCEQRIRSGHDVVASLAELATLFHGNGLYPEAAHCYQGLLRVDPGNPRWPHLLANILAGFGQLDDAVVLWRRTLSLKSDYTPAQIHLADSLLKLNHPKEASEVYEQVLKRDPGNAYALLGLARLDMEAGRWIDARKRLENAVSSSNYRVGYDLLVTACEHLGDQARADEVRSRSKASGAFIDIADPWLRDTYFDSYDSFMLSLAGGTAESQGDLSFAVSMVERAISLEPTNGYYYVQDYLLYLQLKDPAGGLQILLTGTQKAPTCADVWHELALYYRNTGQNQQAIQADLDGLAHCPDSPSLHYVRGEYLVAAGRLQDAIPEFQQTASIKTDDGSPHMELAQIYFSLNRMSDGLSELNRALAAEPDYPPALTVLASYYIAVHDEPNARIWMQRVRNQPRISTRERGAMESAFARQFGSAPY